MPSIESKQPDDAVLKVATGGGFVPVELSLAELPTFVLYADGRVITQGPQIMIFPGPALPSVVVRKLSRDGIERVLETAAGAGLTGPDRNLDHAARFVADAPTTTFTFSTDDGAHETSVYAIDFVSEIEGLSAAEREEVARLLNLKSFLEDLEGRLPEGSVSSDEIYRPEEMRLYVTPHVTIPPEPDPASPEGTAPAPEPEQPPVAWPLPGTLAEFGSPSLPEGFRCGTVTGSDLEAVLEAAGRANQQTPWTSGGSSYRVVFRPLLPDESGC